MERTCLPCTTVLCPKPIFRGTELAFEYQIMETPLVAKKEWRGLYLMIIHKTKRKEFDEVVIYEDTLPGRIKKAPCPVILKLTDPSFRRRPLVRFSGRTGHSFQRTGQPLRPISGSFVAEITCCYILPPS
jgi:hypothetical protein